MVRQMPRQQLGARISQRQKLLQTPSMQLTMRIMMAQSSTLRQFVRDAVDENPFLDAGLPEWSSSSAGDVNLDGFAEEAVRSVSLVDHVMKQIRQIFTRADDRHLALQMVTFLSPFGWLDDDAEPFLKAMGFVHGFDDPQPSRLLAGLHAMTPAGLFARDLKECLSLQILDRGEEDPDCMAVLEHLEVIAEGMDALHQKTGLSEDRLHAALTKIRRCNPKPGASFIYDEGDIFTPDLIMSASDEGIDVSINQDSLPTMSLKSDVTPEDEAGHILLADAKHQVSALNAAIKNRAEMLLKAGILLAQIQQDFLIKGEAYIKPLNMDQIAEKMDCHKSTVSRLVADKLVQGPHGMMAMSEFFASGLKQPHGGVIAGRAVKAKIDALDHEHDQHLSDQAICTILKEDGIVIARRTVNKYRQ